MSGILYDLSALALESGQTRVITMFLHGLGQVFSLDGRPTSAGDKVAAVGPTLTLNPERVPADGTAPDLASLRKQCKTLVVPVGK